MPVKIDKLLDGKPVQVSKAVRKMTMILQTSFYLRTVRRSFLHLFATLSISFLISACGLFAGPEAEPTPAAPQFTPIPTFTATPASAAQPAPTEPLPPPTPTTAPIMVAAPLTATALLTTVAAITPTVQVTPTAIVAAAQLIVAGDAINIRRGPDVSFEIVGAANTGQEFAITGKNATGDWWQVCCIEGAQPDGQGWIFGELAQVQNVETVAVVTDLPTAVAAAPTDSVAAPAADTPTAEPAPAAAPTAEPTSPPVAAVPQFGEGSNGNFDPNAQYQIVHFKVRGLEENNGGIRDSSAQHLILLTVLDANGNGVDGAVVRNAVGEKLDVATGNKGPGKAEITMYYEPFKLYVASDPSGPVTSQVSNQMGLIFPHLPDIVGKLGDVNYEYGACPTLEIKCEWPLAAIHFSYEITFQKVK